MINYFRKLISGYTLEKKYFRGKEYRFSFQGKPIFFDPVQILQEFHNRKVNSGTQHFPLTIDRSELLPFLPQLPKDALPTVVCTGPNGHETLEVSRFTFKRGVQPVSMYRFVQNGTHAGDFYRIYDYGSETQNFILKVASMHGVSVSLAQEQVIWERGQGEAIFIEKFGHTQIWDWTRVLPA